MCATAEADKKGGRMLDSTTIRESFDHFDAAAALARRKTKPRGTLLGHRITSQIEVVPRDRRGSLETMVADFERRAQHQHHSGGSESRPPGDSFSSSKRAKHGESKRGVGLARLGSDLGAFLPVCVLPQIVHGKSCWHGGHHHVDTPHRPT